MMLVYPTLLIWYVYTVLYTIYCILPMPHGHRSSMYLLIPLHLCVYKVVVVKLLDYLLDIIAWPELEALRYTHINIC